MNAKDDNAAPAPAPQLPETAFAVRAAALLAAASLSATVNISPADVINIARKFEGYLDGTVDEVDE